MVIKRLFEFWQFYLQKELLFCGITPLVHTLTFTLKAIAEIYCRIFYALNFNTFMLNVNPLPQLGNYIKLI